MWRAPDLCILSIGSACHRASWPAGAHLFRGDGVADASIRHRLDGRRQVAHLASVQPVNLFQEIKVPRVESVSYPVS